MRRAALSGALALLLAFIFLPRAAYAQTAWDGGTRSLKIYVVHTQEQEEVVFKRNGRYVPAGLKRLDYLLRDWRRNEAINMDPRLFDLVWQVYQLSGSHDYIHVLSGYRSPQTNNMLRLSSPYSGVAKHSRHMEGKAMDFYLPDVNIAYLRAIALKLQGGGIGYYPTSGSPFVHMDVGNVRHWPRMSYNALAALFPNGYSMHVPSNGRPLAHYAAAAEAYKDRNAAPLPIFSARKLFAGLTPKQVILAAADGRLPNSRYGRGRDMQGMTDSWSAPNLPPVMAAEPPLMAEANLPEMGADIPSGELKNVPIPVPMPGEADNAEAAEDEADIAAAPVPVPQLKEDMLMSESDSYNRLGRGKIGHDEIGGLLAYAPVPPANAAVQALTAAVPVPAAKPDDDSEAAADSDAAFTENKPARAAVHAPLPRAKPRQARKPDAIGAMIAEAGDAAIPEPVLKEKAAAKKSAKAERFAKRSARHQTKRTDFAMMAPVNIFETP